MISALPTPPSRQDPTNFNDRADAFLGALPQFQSEANALQTNVNTSEVNAVNSAAAVLAATNIVKWVSGTTYANGAVVWSPINGLGYRRITASGSGTTDPSADSTNYKQVNGTGDVSTSGNQTIAGVKTFTSTITGSVSGTSGNVVGVVAVANGGTGATTAVNAFSSIKQPASDTTTGVVELATNAETQTGTDTTRSVTPSGLAASMFGGVGQAWSNVTGSRAGSTTYTNSTGRPIQVLVTTNALANAFSPSAVFFTDSVERSRYMHPQSTIASDMCSSITVPVGATYRVELTNCTIAKWSEFR